MSPTPPPLNNDPWMVPKQIDSNSDNDNSLDVMPHTEITSSGNDIPIIITVQKPQEGNDTLIPVNLFPGVTVIQENPETIATPVLPVQHLKPGIYPKLQTRSAPLKRGPRTKYDQAIANLKESGVEISPGSYMVMLMMIVSRQSTGIMLLVLPISNLETKRLKVK